MPMTTSMLPSKPVPWQPSSRPGEWIPGLPQIVLGDTKVALMKLGQAWRHHFKLPVVAVTGSNGKTTTKEMIASILAAWQGEAARLATQGNLNNEIGVPLTLLRLRPAHGCAVIELGMNHPDEIAGLAQMARPTVGLVNNAQREHQEFMHSVEAVARENGQVFTVLPENGVAVFPADDPYTSLWKTYGELPCCDDLWLVLRCGRLRHRDSG